MKNLNFMESAKLGGSWRKLMPELPPKRPKSLKSLAEVQAELLAEVAEVGGLSA